MKFGDTVIITLPDGHEIEGVFQIQLGLYPRVRLTDGSIIYVNRDHLRPVDPPEPTTFGARVIDGKGRRAVRTHDSGVFSWRVDAPVMSWRAWSELARPITVIDADPSWEEGS